MIQFHRETNNCFQDIISMILKNNNKNPLLMYQGSLNFGYNKESKSLWGERITPSRDGRWLDCALYESLKDNYGFILEQKECKNIDELSVEINKRNGGIILEADVYNCKWHLFGGKFHSLHYCWVIGYENGFLKCVIPFGELYGLYDIQQHKENLGLRYFLYSFDYTIKEKTGFYILQKAYNNCNIGWKGKSDIEQMIDMKKDLTIEKINIKKESLGYQQIFSIPLIRALEWVSWSRINVRDMLSLYNKKGMLDKVIIDIQKAIDSWLGIKNYIIRAVLKQKEEVGQEFVNIINDVIDEEMEILEDIYKIIGR